ncbi:MAG: ABC transporter permease DevC [Nostoc sp. DedQUE08]|uniref:ABC transporter permease DevC n=1 Tax=unclassified Nostoc TaxID=2593658 RepID=UPI002AD57D0A|nr:MULTISPECIES: ABC transporter permease DevC [unclassified Nostoc]MDZ8034720.1 ABC transporter permease DevC [Nostoc sp. DedSLP04]MDZ8065188.1 ABC transporter permease DevC [Nostoc sp. DedQUE08]
MSATTPVAWLQLIHRKSRLVVTITGVTFAVMLMFIQLGFRDGLFEDAVVFHKKIQADLVLLHRDTERFFDMKVFPRRYLYNISAVDGIASVNPFYFSVTNFKNPETFVNRPIAIAGFTPDQPVFNLPEVNQQKELIKAADTILFDRLSRPEFGPIVAELEKHGEVITEVSNRQIKVRGLFSLGGGVMTADGVIITSDLNYSEILNHPLEKVQMGVIQVKPGVDPESIIKKISKDLPQDVKLMTLENYIKLEKDVLAQSTPIGFIFNMGTVIGCVFGGIIVYQILYTQISDSLFIYATFKAIGYANSYLVKVVLQQAILMSLIGYIPGFAVCMYLYNFVQEATRLPMIMTITRGVTVMLLTIVMCSLAGMLAMNKLRSADPAELFG